MVRLKFIRNTVMMLSKISKELGSTSLVLYYQKKTTGGKLLLC